MTLIKFIDQKDQLNHMSHIVTTTFIVTMLGISNFTV